MRILILGGNGFIGKNLIDKLSNNTECSIFFPTREHVDILKYEDISKSIVARIDENPLNMPQFSRSEVQKIVKTFNMYVKFPKSRWPEIELSEEDTPEGNRIYNDLKDEFTDLFFDEKDEDFEAAALEKSVKYPMN